MQDLIAFLQLPYVAEVLAVLVGLIIGSFLNVVIARYPIILNRQWRQECQRFLALPVENFSPLSLLQPRSRCVHCEHTIAWWQNIPVISFIALRGRCYYCHKKISAHYWLVELITAILSVMVVQHFGLTWACLGGLIVTYVLIAITGVDLKTQLIPDTFTIPFIWIGLLFNINAVFVSTPQAIYGALLGYLFPWLIAYAFKKIRHKDGMGHGDFKMLAMLGAWFGPTVVLTTLWLAAILGLIGAVILLMNRKITMQQTFAFGPYIAVSGWLSFMYGAQWLHTWLTLF